jgi:hypothetical protein
LNETAGASAARTRIEMLSRLLTLYSAVKIASCSLAYFSAIVAGHGVDESGAQTFYWIPQVLFYAMYLAASRRLRRFDPLSRKAVMSLSTVSLVAIILYTMLDFTLGPASRDPAMAIAIKLRLLLTGGDVWDVVFPLLAILWLRDVDAEPAKSVSTGRFPRSGG